MESRLHDQMNGDHDHIVPEPGPEPGPVPLERVSIGDGLTVWQAVSLRRHGVLHAFTTRHGGSSTGPRESLDLAGRGSREGRSLAAAEENLSRLRERLGVHGSTRTVMLHQVHGNGVHEDDGTGPTWPPPKADILVSSRSDALLMVRVADCVPILLHDPGTGAAAAIHSGWRGTVARAPGHAIRTLVANHRSEPDRLIAAIGPAIGVARFEVGPEVADRFEAEGLGLHVRRGPGKPRIDLHGAVRQILVEAGVRPGSIEGVPFCTHSNPGECFSYRRDGPDGGRMAAVITPVGSPTVADEIANRS